MLSDEEKQAIEFLKEYQDKPPYIIWKDNMPYNKKIQSQIILNLIEKQSKEIEELKQEKEYLNCIIESDNDNYTNKDKIKAEIEELQEDIKYSANPLSIDNSKFGIKVLQSLLEKE